MDGTVTATNPVLPDFTRTQWATPVERAWWLPLLQEASTAYVELERLAVVHGLRKACWQNIHPDTLVSMTEWARQHHILCVPTNIIRRTSGYSNNSETIRPGDAYDYRCLFIRPEWYEGLKFSTDDERGYLLGYPACCRAHFDATWGKGQVDSTYEQVRNSVYSVALEPHTLLRSLGVRLVSHMPCSFNCHHSAEIAQDTIKLAEKTGYNEQVKILQEVMKWPIHWTRLFGIAEYVTPALKITTRSDWTPYQQQFQTPDHDYHKPESWLWTDNGFSEPGAMRASHNVLLDTLKVIRPQERVLDLGCGNGLLLKRLKIQRPDVKIGGVDVNDDAIKHAGFGTGKWRTAPIQDTDAWSASAPHTVLINPVRLLEMAPQDAMAVRLALRASTVLVYAYPDATRTSSLEALCATAGLPVPWMLHQTPLVSVGMIPRA